MISVRYLYVPCRCVACIPSIPYLRNGLYGKLTVVAYVCLGVYYAGVFRGLGYGYDFVAIPLIHFAAQFLVPERIRYGTLVDRRPEGYGLRDFSEAHLPKAPGYFPHPTGEGVDEHVEFPFGIRLL